jgi:uncharacterized protein (TIGR02145 family)
MGYFWGKISKKKGVVLLGVLGVAGAVVFGFVFRDLAVQSASFSFFQTDWSGGASPTATATHPGDQTGWSQFASKDSVVDTGVSGQASLSTTTLSHEETSTADFSAGTHTKTAATSGKVSLLKPIGVSCSSDAECQSGICSGGACFVCEGSINYAGQDYGVVEIGSQCWLGENLNVGTRIDGSSEQTDNATIEKYCYDDSESNCDTDGGLYQWNEMMQYSTTEGAQGICPDGWHIPTDAEWYELENFLATGACSDSRTDWGCIPAGTKLQEGGSSGFEGLLAGYRHGGGSFISRGSGAYFWSSSESGSNAWRRSLLSSVSAVYRYAYDQAGGYSARCLKD